VLARETVRGRRNRWPWAPPLTPIRKAQTLEERREDIKLESIHTLQVPQEAYVSALRLAH
jgi:hypothetical protein